MSEQVNLVTLRRCSQVWEAEILRDRLESAGFSAFVQGAESGRSLSYVGLALGGVLVQVPQHELERAQDLLANDARQREQQVSWTCPRCGEPNEAAFDLCYSCSLPRGQQAEHASGGDRGADDQNSDDQNSGRADWGFRRQVGGVALGGLLADRLADLESTAAGDDRIRRAWLWGAFGTVFGFPPFHLIALFLAAKVWCDGGSQVADQRNRLFLLFVLMPMLMLVSCAVWLSILQ